MQQDEGLYDKYVVYKVRSDGKINSNHERGVFVLKPREDAAARAALMHYANLTPDMELADDLWGWLWDIDNAEG